ncbi:hypothetical protein [Streptomyces sp. NPDC057381]|uniref:hypothetical protein n=1 Tax=Streptomyces sp. NPDC057381 TaxID=3346111 RepID=UPI003637690F
MTAPAQNFLRLPRRLPKVDDGDPGAGRDERPAGQSLDRSACVPLTRLETGEPLTLEEPAHTFQAAVSAIDRQVAAMLRQDLVERPEATGP